MKYQILQLRYLLSPLNNKKSNNQHDDDVHLLPVLTSGFSATAVLLPFPPHTEKTTFLLQIPIRKRFQWLGLHTPIDQCQYHDVLSFP